MSQGRHPVMLCGVVAARASSCLQQARASSKESISWFWFGTTPSERNTSRSSRCRDSGLWKQPASG